jgi:hypothetical protein
MLWVTDMYIFRGRFTAVVSSSRWAIPSGAKTVSRLSAARFTTTITTNATTNAYNPAHMAAPIQGSGALASPNLQLKQRVLLCRKIWRNIMSTSTIWGSMVYLPFHMYKYMYICIWIHVL